MADQEPDEPMSEKDAVPEVSPESALQPSEDVVPQGINEVHAERSARAAKKESTNESLRILEVLLFASDEIVIVDRLKAILPGQPDARRIRSMVDALNVQLQKERHPFEIVEAAGGYQFRTVSYYYPWVSQLFKEKTAKKLSIQSLECLAIIAYKQPITKAEIEAIRGVLSDGAMKTLLEKRLVTIAGRSEKAGRPLLYVTTKDFLSYFGLNKLTDLPDINDFEALAKEKLADLTETELTTITEIAPIPDEPVVPEQPEYIAEETDAPAQEPIITNIDPVQE